jgi:hypothetical protein
MRQGPRCPRLAAKLAVWAAATAAGVHGNGHGALHAAIPHHAVPHQRISLGCPTYGFPSPNRVPNQPCCTALAPGPGL